MSTLTKEQVLNRMKAFNKRAVVDSGVYKNIEVTNVHELDNGNTIVNFSAHTAEAFDLGKEELKAGQFDEFTGHNLSKTVWEDSDDYIPTKGEFLQVTFGMVYSKRQEKDVMGVLHYRPMEAKEATKRQLDMDEFENLLDGLEETSAVESARPVVN